MEGAFARAFKSGLRPVELGRRLVREMDDNRSVDVRGGTRRAQRLHRVALGERPRAVRGRAGQPRPGAGRRRPRARPRRGLRLHGPGRGRAAWSTTACTPGAFHIIGRMVEGEGGAGAGSIVLPNGDRFALTESIITIGRHPDSNLVLADPNVSRNHAEIRPQGDRFAVVDLGSTNGTRVNGVRVDTQVLQRRRRDHRSATPGCASRRRDGYLHARPDRGPCPTSSSTSSSSSSSCCSTSSSSACCGRCGPRSTRPRPSRRPGPSAKRARPRGARPAAASTGRRCCASWRRRS